MHTLSRDTIKQLVELSHSPGLMLSCYVNLKVQGASERPGILKIKHAASLLKQSIPESLSERTEFEQNMNRIIKALDDPSLHNNHAIAIFTAKQRDQFMIVPLGMPILTELVNSDRPYLVPLLQCHFAQQREYLGLTFDNDQARIFLANAGTVKLLKHWHSDVPTKQHSSGDRGAWSQSNIASRREEMLDRHQKEMIDGFSKALQEHPQAGILLLGHEVEVTQLKNKLPPHLSGRLVHTGVCNNMDSEKSQSKTILEIVRKQNVLHAQSLLKELKRRQSLKTSCAVGPADVLAALDTGRLTQKGSLLLGPDPKEDAFLCTSCRHLALDEVKQCPRCGSGCKSCNLWEEILLRAFRHQWNVVPVDGSEGLTKSGFIAMLLEV
ncbi:MAG TPA: hypothetical protein PLN21_00210 [Gemmatales bacterium]|nr:hypothetical protein [Gemmatales bacterium]